MPALEKIQIEGFKSIRKMVLELRPLNVLIGANGAGKSNFIAAFKFLNELINQNLQLYVGKYGGVDSFLHFGQQTTSHLRFAIDFMPDATNLSNGYSCDLTPSTNDSFVFSNEVALFHDRNQYQFPYHASLGKGHEETKLSQATSNRFMIKRVKRAMSSWQVYHFHDTSETAKVKQTGDVDDNRLLRPDASNLAAYLYLLQETEPAYYHNIVGAIRLIAPFFAEFQLQPSALNPEKIRLEWREKGSDEYFNAHALSDGTLRFISLATLLLQPPQNLPSTILLDEPELGLHPYAITTLANMLQSASEQTQVIVSTQSVNLVNQLNPEDIVVVDREAGQSVFKRLSELEIENWLEDYGLGELWEKNVLGGRPA